MFIVSGCGCPAKGRSWKSWEHPPDIRSTTHPPLSCAPQPPRPLPHAHSSLPCSVLGGKIVREECVAWGVSAKGTVKDMAERLKLAGATYRKLLCATLPAAPAAAAPAAPQAATAAPAERDRCVEALSFSYGWLGEWMDFGPLLFNLNE